MASGGFRDISTLSTGRRPRSQTMSTDEEDLRDVEGSNLLDGIYTPAFYNYK